MGTEWIVHAMKAYFWNHKHNSFQEDTMPGECGTLGSAHNNQKEKLNKQGNASNFTCS